MYLYFLGLHRIFLGFVVGKAIEITFITPFGLKRALS